MILIVMATYSFSMDAMQNLHPLSDGHKIFTYYTKLALGMSGITTYLTIRDALTLVYNNQCLGINYGSILLDAAALTLSLQSLYFSMKWRKDCANNSASSCVEFFA